MNRLVKNFQYFFFIVILFLPLVGFCFCSQLELINNITSFSKKKEKILIKQLSKSHEEFFDWLNKTDFFDSHFDLECKLNIVYLFYLRNDWKLNDKKNKERFLWISSLLNISALGDHLPEESEAVFKCLAIRNNIHIKNNLSNLQSFLELESDRY